MTISLTSMKLVLKNLFITEIFKLFITFRRFHYIQAQFLLCDWKHIFLDSFIHILCLPSELFCVTGLIVAWSLHTPMCHTLAMGE